MNGISELDQNASANGEDGFSPEPFTPLRPLRNAHLMTIAASFWRRSFPTLPAPVCRDFEVEPGSKVRAACHWQQNPREHATLVLLHGLEGSCDSGYILGTAEKAFAARFNVLRLNQRNCGGTDQLTPTLYHSGLSGDIRTVLLELIGRDRVPELFAAGFSMGGNLVLKMAGEFGDAAPLEIRAFVAVAPALDLGACANALGARSNFLYQHHFVTRLKRHMRLKARLFPERYSLDGMHNIRTVRDFDDVITARFCGFENADDYYARASALRVVAKIRRPTLVVTAKDDPFIPFASFGDRAIRDNPNVTLVATEHGGHCAYISRERDNRFWAETQIVQYCLHNSKLHADVCMRQAGVEKAVDSPDI